MKKWEHKQRFKKISLWKKSTSKEKKKNRESNTKGARKKVLSQILNENYFIFFGQP